MTIDEFQWLEEVEAERSLKWVDEQNKITLDRLTAHPSYRAFEKEAHSILTAKDRLPMAFVFGDFVYNFWQDDRHVRGIWRRTSLNEFKKPHPEWDVLLDVDALAEAEKENWVFRGTERIPTHPDRCLIYLSKGGKDAVVTREFDLEKKTFLKDGFYLPEGKNQAEWLDTDTLLVGYNHGPDSLTDSGYARTIKIWKRGVPLDLAPTVFEGEKSDVSVVTDVQWQNERKTVVYTRYVDFFTSQFFVPHQEELLKLPVPGQSTFVGVVNDQIIFSLHSDWKIDEKRVVHSGCVISFSLNEFLKSGQVGSITTLLDVTPTMSVPSAIVSADAVVLSYFENVEARVKLARWDGRSWQTKLLQMPEKGSVQVMSSHALSPYVLLAWRSFFQAPQLYLYDGQNETFKLIKEMPNQFETVDLQCHQYFATSRDGTRIPYFIMGPKTKLDGTSSPTLLEAYGGFMLPWGPEYNPLCGKLWLESGGVYVVANIRGGGEFGPRWHQAALKENRQKAFDDFIAVAEDLIARKITSPDKLGIRGGSNGGLLMGAVFTQRPDLFKAVVCQVPLLDMLRYHRLLAGASWMAEYGDPEVPKMREVILKYSPYHNLKSELKYPKVFFMTSTKDDRVHPGHARKMAAKMKSMGKEILYYENRDGGHAGAADQVSRARFHALSYVFLVDELGLSTNKE